MFVLCIVPRLILEPFRSRLEGEFSFLIVRKYNSKFKPSQNGFEI